MRSWVAVTGLLAACASPAPSAAPSSVGHVTPRVPASRTITVTVHGGCPGTLGRGEDVAVQRGIPGHRLLPTGDPSIGLICAYAGGRLHRSLRLGHPQAVRLAGAIGRVSLAPARGAFSCPAALAGSDTVIAFDYPGGRSADLWYATSGCQTLDNGDVLAFQGANESFYSGFEDALAGVE